MSLCQYYDDQNEIFSNQMQKNKILVLLNDRINIVSVHDIIERLVPVSLRIVCVVDHTEIQKDRHTDRHIVTAHPS